MQFSCTSCGADLKFDPGTQTLKCPYCGAMNEIPVTEEGTSEAVSEQDYLSYLEEARSEKEFHEVMTIRCANCGSETTMDPNVTASSCAFCGTSYVQTAQAQRVIKPQALLPFKVTRSDADSAFKSWITSRWFAPSKLKHQAERSDGLQGVYIPHWTYDADTSTDYVGRRGEYYYVTETYTAMEDGKPVQRTRQVRHTRWYPASGRVFDQFDDVLVVASTTLPGKYVAELEPWDLEALVPYEDAYQSGFRTESYNVDLEGGFDVAKKIMDTTIYQTIKRDIGGDEQQVVSKQTRYSSVSFKHILLPIWISAYRFQDKVFRFLVNARTGEIQGERPYSWIKITLLVILVLIVIAVIVMFAENSG